MMQMESAERQRQLSLLLVDDDVELCGMMREFFTLEGHRLDCAYNGREGLTAALNGVYDLVILDVMLPVVDGFELLQRLRKRKDLPVIMLTARVQQQDRIRGLDSGADDYLPKPFDPAELVARIRAILRRSEPRRPASAALALGDIEVDGGARTVRRGGAPVDLTTVEFDLLVALMCAAGSTVSREDLVSNVLGRDFSPFDRSIDTHVCNLRRKLGPLEDGAERIKGVRGAGYLYAKPVPR
jgi:two-component system response regulator CpxR